MDEVPLPEEVALGGDPPVTDEDVERWADGADESDSMRAFADSEFDTEKAEWAMGRLRRAQARITDNAQQAEEWITRVQAWLIEANRRDQHEAAYFSNVLCSMLRRLNEGDPSIKSITLPSGRITSQGPAAGNEYAPRIDKDHEAELIAWAEAYFPDVVKTEQSVLVSKLREHLWRVDERGVRALDPATGEVMDVPGVVPHFKERSYTAIPDLT